MNQIIPPPTFALRHRQLIDLMLSTATLETTLVRSDPVRLGQAEGLVDVTLTNLAYAADPTVKP